MPLFFPTAPTTENRSNRLVYVCRDRHKLLRYCSHHYVICFSWYCAAYHTNINYFSLQILFLKLYPLSVANAPITANRFIRLFYVCRNRHKLLDIAVVTKRCVSADIALPISGVYTNINYFLCKYYFHNCFRLALQRLQPLQIVSIDSSMCVATDTNY